MKKNKKTQIERTIPLTIELDSGKFMLKPLERDYLYNTDVQPFKVTFKFYDTIGLTKRALLDVKDLKKLIKDNCMTLLMRAAYPKILK